MMTAIAKIISLAEGDRLWVELLPRTACAHCVRAIPDKAQRSTIDTKNSTKHKQSAFCTALFTRPHTIQVRLTNNDNAIDHTTIALNQMVEIGIEEAIFLRTVICFYGLALLALFSGMFLLHSTIGSDYAVALGAGFGLLGFYVFSPRLWRHPMFLGDQPSQASKHDPVLLRPLTAQDIADLSLQNNCPYKT